MSTLGSSLQWEGKRHRHAPLRDVLVSFVEYRETTDDGADHSDGDDIGIPRAAKKPDRPPPPR